MDNHIILYEILTILGWNTDSTEQLRYVADCMNGPGMNVTYSNTLRYATTYAATLVSRQCGPGPRRVHTYLPATASCEPRLYTRDIVLWVIQHEDLCVTSLRAHFSRSR